MLANSIRSSVAGSLRNASAKRISVARTMATLTDEKRLPSKFGGKYTVTLIPGDGIGQEVADSVKEVFDALKVPVQWEQYNVSGETTGGEALFQEAMDSLKRNKVGLKGILYTPVDQSGHNSWNVAMRQQLDIYASVVVCKSLPGLATRHSNVDFAIIRENTEGEYSGLEHQSFPGVVESLKVSTRAKAERIARFAFDFALKNNRKKVTCVHKANIMKLGDGLFLNTCKRVAEQEYGHTGIKFESMIVDNTAMQLVSKPQQFDVMVMPNLYGAISTNIGSALVGGPGITPGCNFGREYALFEPGCRHVGKDIMGTNKANPIALMLSATMMLRHLGLESQANLIAGATYDLVKEGKVRTADIGGNSTTTDVTKALINRLL
ncbi:isocitrate dehydrogenase, NAD-dependent [Cryptococcus deuterogattii 99/473]|uniref:Isocitrate dehydrogenase [NAD] subunit 1, mitochondrial n=2 Tax=Cryptococcus deuterogattii TaxID=1859096 RepID=A0A0D0V0W7_9TREE|nr:isocitrate dehydrogenase NAD-dependent [Cryptococcus deuterogattii R265]KIR26284.1 isocitrate dehydrogenase, NAD-dependent [Cryptococcus deuterogattii LA55]KIR33048.1 isocitrate dehydrogenase, NAD-dependent [Cryptococcus deuterogattii MMRL2647]KIR41076.1 isocitrate dehydrogenase, NAD-dependent [Cryptococcus deuterogattii Ram5]KIR72431.1 isocitrate dehydrogenase, NAD-dependent [Cryptococcus deuterogattii CA1014]KIR92024.1 isocitrate dehydrogenase, NAD-dependent [Cryptococcus deuterogattii CB